MGLIKDLLASHPHLTYHARPVLDEQWYSILRWPEGGMVNRYDGSLVVIHRGKELFRSEDFGWRNFNRDIPRLRAALEQAGLVWPPKYDRASAWPDVQWPPLKKRTRQANPQRKAARPARMKAPAPAKSDRERRRELLESHGCVYDEAGRLVGYYSLDGRFFETKPIGREGL